VERTDTLMHDAEDRLRVARAALHLSTSMRA